MMMSVTWNRRKNVNEDVLFGCCFVLCFVKNYTLRSHTSHEPMSSHRACLSCDANARGLLRETKEDQSDLDW